MRHLLLLAIALTSTSAYAGYVYKDYAGLRDTFEVHKQSINTKINDANKRYISSLNQYRQCSSEKWRVAFTTVIPEIDQRRLELDKYKRTALTQSGKLNTEWLKMAKAHGISQTPAESDISDFYYWYKNHIELAKQGPMHELEIYTIALSKLSGTYETMAAACSGDPKAAQSYDLVESGIRGLLDEVFSLIGMT
ncbi:exported hypothetical protein [Vibrio owensii]|uniref:ATPase n=1 Tax=Vibrio owensii TaxID=696485 RepID=A0AAU9Q201_9VIBR|nr:hypothetical protein [Vibrio parahaemolyticus]TMX38710.1 hypothetical protein DA098_12325 [Vibrio parahaemolyticus]TMX73037.1 hypothetical protein DA094_24695 [Vibrio parahaemolyticus]CAH1523593.1 exported hypothetical protein [Vibrio owensii]